MQGRCVSPQEAVGSAHPGFDLGTLRIGPNQCAVMDLVVEVLGDELGERVAAVLGGEYSPRLHKRQSMQFQLTRGLLGVSL